MLNKKIKIISTKQFIKLNTQGRNQGLDYDAHHKLDPLGIHIIHTLFVHNDVEWRTWAYLNFKDEKEPVRILFDIGFKDYDKLPEIEIDVDELENRKTQCLTTT